MRRTPSVVLAATVLAGVLALVTGCGREPAPAPAAIGEATSVAVQAPPATSPATSPAGAPPPASSPDPLLATPPEGTTAVPATRVDTSALPPGFPATVWTRGARTVGVYGPAGGCTNVDARVSAQDGRQVTLAVVQSSNGADACTRELRYRPFDLPLDADLGARRVVLTGTATG